jgi:hypothetical protein
MIAINTRTYPYRLDHTSKEPIELFIKLTNGGVKRLLSIDLVLDEDLSFDRVKPVNTDYKRLGEFEPNQSKEIKLFIYPATGSKPGMKPVKIRVGEHSRDYNYVDNKNEQKININVV